MIPRIYHNVCIADFSSEIWENIDIEKSYYALFDFIEQYEIEPIYGNLNNKPEQAFGANNRISHSIEHIIFSDNKLFATVRILHTIFGKELNVLLETIPIENFYFIPVYAIQKLEYNTKDKILKLYQFDINSYFKINSNLNH